MIVFYNISIDLNRLLFDKGGICMMILYSFFCYVRELGLCMCVFLFLYCICMCLSKMFKLFNLFNVYLFK